MHRYFQTQTNTQSGKSGKGKPIPIESCYRDAEVEIFMTACPAMDMYWLVQERIALSLTRENIKLLLNEGVMNAEKTQDDDCKEENEDTSSKAVVDTVELSLGSVVIQLLDNDAFGLERSFAETFQLWRREKFTDEETFRLSEPCDIVEWSTAEDFRIPLSKLSQSGYHSAVESKLYRDARKASRLRIYIGTLLAFGLESAHNFEDESVEKVMQKDFATANGIGVGNGEDKEAFDRINFLVDIAECRIRDTILCGWHKLHGEKHAFDGPLPHCLDLMINGYYIEIIALLANFFGSKGIKNLTGLERKNSLISFFLKNNNRLSDMVSLSNFYYHFFFLSLFIFYPTLLSNLPFFFLHSILPLSTS